MRRHGILAVVLGTLLNSASWLALAAPSAHGQEKGFVLPPRCCAQPVPCLPSEAAPPPAVTAPEQLPAPAVEPTLAFGPGGGLEGLARGTTPEMLGDLLGGSRSILFRYSRTAGDVNVAGNGFLGIVNPKVAENNSPMPQDRISFRFNHYDNALAVSGISSEQIFDPAQRIFVAPTTTKSYDLQAYTFSFEKTFFDRLLSVELRVPIITTLAAKNILSAGTVQAVDTSRTDGFGNFILDVAATPQNTFGNQSTQFDNMSLILKALAYHNPRIALSGGVSVGIPTGPDARTQVVDFLGPVVQAQPVNSIQRVRDFQIDNEIWSLSPFLAVLATPDDRWFAQGFLQFDFPLNSSTIRYTEVTTQPGFRNDPFSVEIVRTTPGRLLPPFTVNDSIDEQTLMHVDVGVGYWITRNCQAAWLTGIAPTLELHYTTTLENADIRTLPGDPSIAVVNNRVELEANPLVGNLRNRVDILDVTVGTTFEIANQSTLALGCSFPLKRESDRTFDWEFQLQFNWRFGGPARTGACPF